YGDTPAPTTARSGWGWRQPRCRLRRCLRKRTVAVKRRRRSSQQCNRPSLWVKSSPGLNEPAAYELRSRSSWTSVRESPIGAWATDLRSPGERREATEPRTRNGESGSHTAPAPANAPGAETRCQPERRPSRTQERKNRAPRRRCLDFLLLIG